MADKPIPTTRLATHLLHRRTPDGNHKIPYAAALLRLHVAHTWTQLGEGTAIIEQTFSAYARWLGFSSTTGLSLRAALKTKPAWGISYDHPALSVVDREPAATDAPTVPRDCVRTIFRRLAGEARADRAALACFAFFYVLHKSRGQPYESPRAVMCEDLDADDESLAAALRLLADVQLITQSRRSGLGRPRASGPVPETLVVHPAWEGGGSQVSNDKRLTSEARIAELEAIVAQLHAQLASTSTGNPLPLPGVSPTYTGDRTPKTGIIRTNSGDPPPNTAQAPGVDEITPPITGLSAQIGKLTNPGITSQITGVPNHDSGDTPLISGGDPTKTGHPGQNDNRRSEDRSSRSYKQEEEGDLPPPPPDVSIQRSIERDASREQHANAAILERAGIRLDLSDSAVGAVLDRINPADLAVALRERRIEDLWDIRVAMHLDGKLGGVPLDGADIISTIAEAFPAFGRRASKPNQQEYISEWVEMLADAGLRRSGVMSAMTWTKSHFLTEQKPLIYARHAQPYIQAWIKRFATEAHVISKQAAVLKSPNRATSNHSEVPPRLVVGDRLEGNIWTKVLARAFLVESNERFSFQDWLASSRCTQRADIKMWLLSGSVHLSRHGGGVHLVVPDQVYEREIRRKFWATIKSAMETELGCTADLVVGPQTAKRDLPCQAGIRV